VPSDREISELVERFGVEPQSTRGVLLVDDEELNLRVLRGFLEDQWTIHEASSGAQALAIADEVPLDVVIADQRMPGMTGVEMLTELRHRRDDVAGIILTAYADMPSMESAINRANVFRFMRKPFEPPDVVQAVDQASADVVHRRTIAKLVELLAERGDELRRSLDELQTQQQMLLHLERLGTIGKLAAGVTHDLRSLMVAFRAAEWEMQKATIPPALREIVTLGLAGAENMVHTLGTLQEFSRTGKVTLELEPVDPAVVVHDALAIAKMDAVYKLHVVSSEVAPGLPPVRGDRVVFGAQVAVQDGRGRRRVLQVVGPDEVDPAHGQVSVQAPLAVALLGAAVGETVSVDLPRGEEELTVLAVTPAED
jgi:CheY-like chemotaxis protein